MNPIRNSLHEETPTPIASAEASKSGDLGYTAATGQEKSSTKPCLSKRSKHHQRCFPWLDRNSNTQHGRSVVKNQRVCRHGCWLEVCIGSTAICKCSPRTGTYVDWESEYTNWYIPNVERAVTMPDRFRNDL